MHFPEDLLQDKAGILYFVVCDLQPPMISTNLKRFSAPQQELVTTALRECGGALRFVPLPLRRDKEVVLAAVQRDGEALVYAGELQVG